MASRAVASALCFQNSLRQIVYQRTLSTSSSVFATRDLQKGKGLEGVPPMTGQHAVGRETVKEELKKETEKMERKGALKEDNADTCDMAEKGREKAKNAGKQQKQ
ncbi:hypothetical protein AAVH_24031 [Aphelenchoides avenae]|nr:hypothetical protein AAVH_24031 [Aphelenchus avenae]